MISDGQHSGKGNNMRFWSDGNEWEEDYAVTKAFKEGKEAREAGIKCSANPHPEKSRESHDWASGWKIADIYNFAKQSMEISKVV